MAGVRLVAVFAHPDDEAFGPAAAVARAVAEGAEAHLICATRGEAGTIGRSATYHPSLLARVRSAELERSAAVLGYRSLHILDYPDRGVDSITPARGVADLLAHLDAIDPHLVLTFHPLGISGHPDHRAMTAFTTAAVEERAGRHGRQTALHFYTVPASVARAIDFRRMPLVDDAEISVEIATDGFAAHKHRAIHCHRTQLPFYRQLMSLGPAYPRWQSECFTTHGAAGPVRVRRSRLPYPERQ
jgi:LmbE family N-acetylglucosaminyl deacetylase